MAGDVTLRYGSTGFSKVKGELGFFSKASKRIEGDFAKVGKSAKATEAPVVGFFTKFRGAIGAVSGVMGRFLVIAAKVIAAVTAVGVAAAGIATAGFLKLNYGMLKTTEGFKLLEISLYGVLKSWDKVRVVSDFAKEYAATYPAMYGDIMRAMSSMAMMPALKGIFTKGDVAGMMDIMNIVQAMATMRPDQGITGALFALREALGGNWRTLQYRFDVPLKSVAATVGMSIEAMRESPQAAMKALKGWTNATVGAETMALAARNLGTQLGNIKDQYEMWLDRLGKTGIYDKVIGFIVGINDAISGLLESAKLDEWTDMINEALEKIADRVSRVFTEGIDWAGIENISELVDAFKQVGKNAMDAMGEAWRANKDVLLKALESAVQYAAEGLAFAVEKIFIPVGIGIGKGIYQGVKSYLEKSPLLGIITKAMALTRPGAPMVKGLYGLGEALGTAMVGGAAAGPGAMPPGWEERRRLETLSAMGIEPVKRLMTGKEEMRALREEGKEPSVLLGLGREDAPKIIGQKIADFLNMMDRRRLERASRREIDIMDLMKPIAKTPLGGPLAGYQMWAGMAGALAKAPREERVSPGMAFATGAIGYEEYRKRGRIEEFQAKQMEKLIGIVEEPEAAQAVRAGGYQQLFGIAMQRGELGKAETFMEKALEAQTGAMDKQAAEAKQAAERDEKRNEFLKEEIEVTKDQREILKGLLIRTPAGGVGRAASYVVEEELGES